MIRSDEWLVQTSFFLGQSMNEKDYYPLVNENIRADGQNMLMVYPSPVADLSIVGKPQNIGFLLFGAEFGYAWYWNLKLILLILMSIEIVMILTKKDALLSLVGGIWLAFSPAIMWWASSNADIYMHAFAIIVIFHYYIENLNWKIWKKFLLGLAMVSSISGFVFCFYPPIQVPMAYLILAFFIVGFIKKRKDFKKLDYLIIGITILLSLVVIGYYLMVSVEDIKLMTSTLYPGKREITGGGMGISSLIRYFINIFTPFTSNHLAQLNYNQSEVAASIYPITALLIMIVISFKDFKKSIKEKSNWIIYAIIAVFVLLILWIFVGFGGFLSKISLFSLAQPGRVTLVLGLVGIMLCLALLKKYENKVNFSKLQLVIISIGIVLLSHILIYSSGYELYLTKIKLLILYPIIFSMSYTYLAHNKKAFCYIILGVTIVSGVTIVPLEKGLGAIYNTQISKNIQHIVSENKDTLWIGETNIDGQLLIANGAKTLNGVNYYPNFNWLTKLDPVKKYEEIYNRYAHISVKLTNQPTYFELLQPDAYCVYINKEDLKDLGIKYYLIRDEVDEDIRQDFKLQLIYQNDMEHEYIYKINL